MAGRFWDHNRRYDPWTEKARWEEAILDKVCAFGGVLVEHTASRLVWVFGVPQGLSNCLSERCTVLWRSGR